MSVIPIRQSGRHLSSWVDFFCEYTDDIQSPNSFRKWSGIVAVAGAIERKVWLLSQGSPIYPNLYVFLVGPPGSGKTRAVSECEQLWRSLPDHKIAPTSLTKASLIDAIKEAERALPGHPELGTYNSLLLAAKELGALLPGYDPDFMNALTYLYDNEPYAEKRRSKDTDFVIKNPILNMVACTTPSFLNETLPAGAWEQGFLSRTIIIQDAGVDIAPLNLLEENKPRDAELEKALKNDIKLIGERVGRLMFERDAAEMLEAWNMSRRKTEPQHPRLTHYNTRRTVHLLKLCIISTVDLGARTITAEATQRAMDWLTEAELHMGDIFLAMASGGDARVINEAHHWLYTHQARFNTPQTGANFRQYLTGRIPSHSVERVIELMFRSGMIEARGTDGVWAKPPST